AKHANDADKQAAYRERKQKTEQQKAEAPERARLWNTIKQRVKKSQHKNIARMKRNLPALQTALDSMTIEEVRQAAKTYGTVHDQKGRSSLEGHTGGHDAENLDVMRGV